MVKCTSELGEGEGEIYPDVCPMCILETMLFSHTTPVCESVCLYVCVSIVGRLLAKHIQYFTSCLGASGMVQMRTDFIGGGGFAIRI